MARKVSNAAKDDKNKVKAAKSSIKRSNKKAEVIRKKGISKKDVLEQEELDELLKDSVVEIVDDEAAITSSTSKIAKAAKSTRRSKTESVDESEEVVVPVKKRATRRRSSKAQSDDKTAKEMLAEYYDLPYRYNQTIVKILAQTPTTLFVYWDVSDEDKKALISAHGENFFNETRPVLIVHNTTHNYSFEIDINDFANSWYIRTQEPNCNYVIELGRKYYERDNNEYIYINSSNNMVSPNDHVLFETVDLSQLLFQNTQTKSVSYKNFGSLELLRSMDRLYGNIYDVYNLLYNDDIFNEICNPSSGEFIVKRLKRN